MKLCIQILLILICLVILLLVILLFFSNIAISSERSEHLVSSIFTITKERVLVRLVTPSAVSDVSHIPHNVSLNPEPTKSEL